jgi:uncharacterized protein (DUF2384 family)
MASTPAGITRTSHVERIKVRPLREWFGLTQEQFATAVGAGLRTVARWEAAGGGPERLTGEGKVAADLVEIRKLATRLMGEKTAKEWLRAPLPILAGRTPIDTILTDRASPVLRVLREDVEGGY